MYLLQVLITLFRQDSSTRFGVVKDTIYLVNVCRSNCLPSLGRSHDACRREELHGVA